MIAVWWILGAPSAVACPGLEVLKQAEGVLADAEPESAASLLTEAMGQLDDCSEPVEPALLGRMWLVLGIAAQLREQDPTAFYRAALRVDPEVWDPLFGPSLHEGFLAANAARPPSATLFVEPLIPGRTWVDGARLQASEITVEAGTHLVQVTPTYARLHELQPGEQLHVTHGVPAPALADVPPLEREPRMRRKPTGLLVGGMAAAVGGGALLAWSVERGAAIPKADQGAVLERRYVQHSVGRIAGPTLLGLGVAGVVAYGAW